MTMNATKRLLEQVQSAHDWTEGQVYSRGGTYYSSTDVCRICGLQRNWHSDTQNGIGHTYQFVFNANELSLLEVSQRSPCINLDRDKWDERAHEIGALKTLVAAYRQEHDFAKDEDADATYELLRDVMAIYDELMAQLG
jgi:hypothetical protein